MELAYFLIVEVRLEHDSFGLNPQENDPISYQGDKYSILTLHPVPNNLSIISLYMERWRRYLERQGKKE
jgi:hypothetical protein